MRESNTQLVGKDEGVRKRGESLNYHNSPGKGENQNGEKG